MDCACISVMNTEADNTLDENGGNIQHGLYPGIDYG